MKLILQLEFFFISDMKYLHHDIFLIMLAQIVS